MERRGIEISWTSLWRIFLILILVVGLYYTRYILVVLALAIVISSALDTPLNFLERKRIPRLLGIIFIFIAFISILFFLLYTVIPITIIEFKDLFNNLDKIESSLGGFFGISKITEKIEISLNDVSSAIFSGEFSIINLLPKVFENAVLLVATIVISFYMALYRNGIENFLKAILPLSYEHQFIDIFHRSRRKIGKWLEGQILLSLIIGVGTAIGLKLLGVNYGLVLGVLAGIFEIIPFIGPVVAGGLAFLVAASQSLMLGVYVIIFFVVLQQIEAHILVPVVMKKTTGIHPVIVVLSILAGSQIAGFIGAILAIPFVVVIGEFVEDYAARKYRQPTL
ncbi:MAG: AI-2E family transporter [Patescibacteria group bacterium]|nr:AI-2E family transporter [Patescibacteria group bacterium]